MTTTIKLNVWLFDTLPAEVFTVAIENTLIVADLKEAVHSKAQQALGPKYSASTVGYATLSLFRGVWDLSDLPLETRDGLESLGDRALDPISNLFTDIDSNKVHVAVALPRGLKRPPSPGLHDESIRRFTKSKIAMGAPSKMAQHLEYMEIQADPNERILDDRPSPDHVPPLALLYPPFGKFLDFVEHPRRPTTPGIYSAVDAISKQLLRFWPGEMEKNDAVLPLVTTVLRLKNPAIPSLNRSSIKRLSTGGHAITDSGVSLAIVVLKNEITNISAHPHAQVVGYYSHLLHNCPDDVKARWRVPSLAITIVGCEICFYGIIWLGGKVRSEILTPSMSFLPSAVNRNQIMGIYQAFEAAIDLLNDIYHDTQRVMQNPPASIENFFLPDVNRLLKPHSKDKYVNFKLTSYYHKDRILHRDLYLARLSDDPQTEIIVKFAKTYCIDLHNFCASQKCAPEILGYEELPGGWKAIAMQYHKDARPLDTSKCEDRLREVVRKFHDAGWVHGDLRNANILRLPNQQFWIIDFDWGGREGTVFYPTDNLIDDLRKGRNMGDLMIRQDDDERVLEQTLKLAAYSNIHANSTPL